MTQGDNKTLLPILCGYLPYGLKVLYISGDGINTYTCDVDMISIASETVGIYQISEPRPQTLWRGIETIRPYLRPLDSITGEERYELQEILGKDVEILDDFIHIVDSSRKTFSFLELQAVFDWLNAHHFDYHGLIKKNLAIEVTKENNPYAN